MRNKLFVFIAKYFLQFATILLILLSCTEVFEEDISKLKVELVSPGENIVLNDNTVTFRWNANSLIEQYRLEIARPSFNQSQAIVLDTLIKSNSFTFNLNPANYQWRVRGENNSYSTGYSLRNLIIDTAKDLSGTRILLISPQDSFQINANGIIFRWAPIVAADQYIFQLSTVGFFFDTLTSETQIFRNIPVDQWLVWEVKATKNGTSTPFSGRRIRVDLSPPSAPTLLNPFDGFTTVTDTVNFEWTSVSDADQYELYLYLPNGSTIAAGYPKLLFTNSSKQVVPNGLSFWDVLSIDKVGNKSPKSSRRQLTNN